MEQGCVKIVARKKSMRNQNVLIVTARRPVIGVVGQGTNEIAMIKFFKPSRNSIIFLLIIPIIIPIVGCLGDFADKIVEEKFHPSKVSWQDVSLSPEKFLGSNIRWVMYSGFNVERLSDSSSGLFFTLNKELLPFITNGEKYLLVSGRLRDAESERFHSVYYVVPNTIEDRDYLKNVVQRDELLLVEGKIVSIKSSAITIAKQIEPPTTR